MTCLLAVAKPSGLEAKYATADQVMPPGELSVVSSTKVPLTSVTEKPSETQSMIRAESAYDDDQPPAVRYCQALQLVSWPCGTRAMCRYLCIREAMSSTP